MEDVIQSLHRQHPNVTYVRLNCVNDDPDFLKIAAEWANPQIESMLTTQLLLVESLDFKK